MDSSAAPGSCVRGTGLPLLEKDPSLMNQQDVRAVLTISLLAAYADNEKHDREREQIRQVAEALAQHEQVNLPALYQDVLMRRVQLADTVNQLTSQQARDLAYEMAASVCAADGQTSAKEAEFLAQLKTLLSSNQGSPAAAEPVANTVDALAKTVSVAPLGASSEPVVFDDLQPGAAPHPTAADSIPGAAAPVKQSTLSTAEMDQKILRAAITNGAIELLPENLSTLAIIPLQMRLVYQIGQSYGYELDAGHIKDLLATLGVGLTSQYLEQAGRKLLGRVLGGGIFGGLGKQAVSSGMSFASTYALGHVAVQYYGRGRTLSTDMLKGAYERIMQEGRSLQTQYAPQMQDVARNLNTAKIMDMVRGR